MKFGWASRLAYYIMCFQLDCKKKFELWSLVGVEPLRFFLHEFEEITGLNCEYVKNLENPLVEVLQVWVYCCLPEFGAGFGHPIEGFPTPPLLAFLGGKGKRRLQENMLKHTRTKNFTMKDYSEMFPRWDGEMEDEKADNIVKAVFSSGWAREQSHWPLVGTKLWTNVKSDAKSRKKARESPGLDVETMKGEIVRWLTGLTSNMVGAVEKMVREAKKDSAEESKGDESDESKGEESKGEESRAEESKAAETAPKGMTTRAKARDTQATVKDIDEIFPEWDGDVEDPGWKWTMDCWKVTGTHKVVKMEVSPVKNEVSPVKTEATKVKSESIVKEESSRPRKKARKGSSISAEAPAAGSDGFGMTKEQIERAFKDISDAISDGFGTCLREIKLLGDRMGAVEKKVGITKKGSSSTDLQLTTTSNPPKPVQPGSESVNRAKVGHNEAKEQSVTTEPSSSTELCLVKPADDLPSDEPSVLILDKQVPTASGLLLEEARRQTKKETAMQIDAFINLLRQRYQDHPQHFRSERMCFLDHIFSRQWRASYPDFKSDKGDANGLARRLPGGALCKLAGFLKTLEYWQRDKFWDLVSRFLILCLEMLETSALGLGQDLGLLLVLEGAMTNSTYVSRFSFILIPYRFKVRDRCFAMLQGISLSPSFGKHSGLTTDVRSQNCCSCLDLICDRGVKTKGSRIFVPGKRHPPILCFVVLSFIAKDVVAKGLDHDTFVLSIREIKPKKLDTEPVRSQLRGDFLLGRDQAE
ncbi:hypothetical protein DY000_02023301 [Brassica cretica]|uniref:DUF1985 domain-containing protein n=1 Tax=Brassica cretica TaxID=69181 RepID=A0ABQ7E425_BRACR|nr:hypothetical protein DY000_02023301 [Brassica cretica]